MWLAHLTVFGQTDGYDPSNPPNPSVPDDDTQYYSLAVKSMPEGIGGLNTLGGKYKEGEEVYLYAYSHDNCTFLRWIDEEGQTLSTNYSLYYTMPARDAVVTAVYEYNPSSPGNPEVPRLPHQLTLVSKPIAGGSFNVSGGTVTVNQGESFSVYAYSNPCFVFLRWENEAGETVSDSYYYNATMGDKDATYYAIFDYRPGNPGNPSSNAWDARDGELIVDDFQPGYAYSAASTLLEKKGVSADDVLSIVMAGKANNSDVNIARNFANCVSLDLTRTAGITAVPSWSYSGNSKLTQIYLPSSVQAIENYAFNNSTALNTLVCLAVTPPTLGYNVFAGIPEGLTVYVPEKSIELYEAADGWKDFIILPYKGNVHSLEVSLPDECSDGRYKNMSLELVNVKSGQKYKYVVTDRLNYIYSGLVKNTVYNAYLKNLSGVVLAQVDEIEIQDDDVAVAFENIKSVHNVTVNYLLPDGSDCTSSIDIRWLNEAGTYMAQGSLLTGQVEGSAVSISSTLPQELALQYAQPSDSLYTVTGDDNDVVINLVALPRLSVSGRVSDKTTDEPIQGVIVTFSQTLNGRYSKAILARTDRQGQYSAEIFSAPTSVTYSSAEYVSQSANMSDETLAEAEVVLDDVQLKPITGAKVTLAVTHTLSAVKGAEPVVEDGYEDYNNISYSIFNATQQRAISQFSVQYPNIVLLEEVSEGDVISVIATSKKDMFEPVIGEGKVDEHNNIPVAIPLLQRGGISVSYTMTENRGVVTMLYDANGALVSKNVYESREVSFENLKAGRYTILTMGKSDFFNDIYSLAGFDEAGLVAGTDYVKTSVEVKDGVVSVAKYAVVPFFDESKLYYTGDNTVFSVNRSTVTVGNYLTLQAKIDFKSMYAGNVSNVNLVVDLPESCQMVENSVMVGSHISVYQLNGTRITVPIDNYTDRTRFCVIPTCDGIYEPSAYVQFDLDGTTMTQPIGSAAYNAKGLSITVPSVVGKPTVPVSGAAIAQSTVEVYDDGMLIGQTQSLANGTWFVSCELYEPGDKSLHNIYAKVTTKDGLVLYSETNVCLYDTERIVVNSVTMINTAHPANNLNLCDYVTVFDYNNPNKKKSPYWYWPSYPTFTFLADLSSNDTARINRVYINVFTSGNEVKQLKASYNKAKDKWIAICDFHSNSLPRTVSVNIDDVPYNAADTACYEILLDENIGELTFVTQETDEGKQTDVCDKDGNVLQHIEEVEKEGTLEDVVSEYVSQGYEIEESLDSIVSVRNPKDNSTSYLTIIRNTGKILIISITRETEGVKELESVIEKIVGSWERIASQIVKCDENAIYTVYDEGVDVLKENVYKITSQLITRRYFYRELSFGKGRLYDTQKRVDKVIRHKTERCTEKVKTGMYVVRSHYTCPPPPPPDPPIIPDVDHVMDPSGYVYEAVESNRLQGVTASVYYKEYVADMFGDIHENIVLWDAEAYAQQNPLFTDENGMYQWDVPAGLWQVKLEKEGYQTAYSEWLPVPPPQLEVNIGMVQNSQPEVKSAKAYDNEVNIEFNKYMKPEYFTADNISLKVKIGETETLCEDLIIELADAEAVSEDDATEYATKVSVKTAADLGLADEVYLIVSSRVRSYAGIPMAGDYNQRLDVEKKIRSIEVADNINVGYEQSQSVLIGALPAEASKGKTLVIKPVSSMIAAVSAEGSTTGDAGQTLVTLDENGQTTINVSGELLGTTALALSVQDADVNKQAIVNVMDPAKLAEVKEPVASRVSGSDVYRGQTVTLSCETEGATLYYTVDGSDPTDEALRMKYEGRPIAINDAMTIKVQAVGANGSESEVKEFSYTIKQTSTNLTLAEGWNWASHNMAADMEPAQLQAEGVSRIKSFDAELVSDPALGFVGDISAVKAEEAIKVETTAEASIALSGEMFNPNAHAISLAEGWNWIGYPLSQTMAVSEALSRLDAEEGDRVSSLEGFAEYSDGEWIGSLATMVPGKGYMYKSTSGKEFTYNDAIVSKAKALNAARLQIVPNPWTVNIHAYPNMMCITADLFEGEAKAEADKYFIAAFSGDECRGVGQYVKGIIFLSVYGDKNVPLTFMAADSETGEVYAINETCEFNADVLGSVKAPFAFHLGEATDVDEIAADGVKFEGVTNILGQQLRRINAQGFYVIDGKKIFINKKNISDYDK